MAHKHGGGVGPAGDRPVLLLLTWACHQQHLQRPLVHLEHTNDNYLQQLLLGITTEPVLRAAFAGRKQLSFLGLGVFIMGGAQGCAVRLVEVRPAEVREEAGKSGRGRCLARGTML